MSKFEAVLKKIEEAMPVTPQQQAAGATQQPTQTPQQQQQAVQQAAKLLNLDPKVLQQILDAQKQQQQKTNTGTQPPATGSTQQPTP
jgi:hypothetical protein